MQVLLHSNKFWPCLRPLCLWATKRATKASVISVLILFFIIATAVVFSWYQILGQYSISKPFPFYILITILIQATQDGRSTWLFCAGWLVMRTKMSRVINNHNENEIEDWPRIGKYFDFWTQFLQFRANSFDILIL